MWSIAVALFASAKWITIQPLLFELGHQGIPRLLAYAFLWPGLDARGFCGSVAVARPARQEWVSAGVKTLFGVLVLWFGVPQLAGRHPLLAGWAGMVGLVFVLHFGSFHLLSLFWRVRGIEAKPLMRRPGTAPSLATFWGGRWNAAFSDLMEEHGLKPLARKLGARWAVMAIFGLSGLLHELVISLPAGGGYGLPTAYFTLQGSGLLLERSRFGQALGLGKGWRGWCFMVLVAGLPAFWLFHPTFVRNVILPMLHAIGAT